MLIYIYIYAYICICVYIYKHIYVYVAGGPPCVYMYIWPGFHPGMQVYGVGGRSDRRRLRAQGATFLGDDLEEELHIYTGCGPRAHIHTHKHIHTPRVCPRAYKCIYTHVRNGNGQLLHRLYICTHTRAQTKFVCIWPGANAHPGQVRDPYFYILSVFTVYAVRILLTVSLGVGLV